MRVCPQGGGGVSIYINIHLDYKAIVIFVELSNKNILTILEGELKRKLRFLLRRKPE